MLSEGGPAALSVRRLADSVSTTTRAVYAVFGGMPGVFSALYRHAFQVLFEMVDAVPVQADARNDLLAVALKAFRRYALTRTNLYRLAFERLLPGFQPTADDLVVAERSLAQLTDRVKRFTRGGQLGMRKPAAVAIQFHAVCQGLAAVELLGLLDTHPEAMWKETLGAYLDGLALRKLPTPGPTRRRAPKP